MSDLPPKKTIVDQLKEKKGRVILLGVIALASMYMWSGILFGKKPKGPAAGSTPPSAAVADGAATPSGAQAPSGGAAPQNAGGVVPLLGPVNTFIATTPATRTTRRTSRTRSRWPLRTGCVRS